MRKIFISYSHKDERWKNEIVKQLRVLEVEQKLSVWDDRKITGGGDWYSEIEQEINTCDVALLLISADFLISDFIRGHEVPKLLDRRRSEGLRLIPIIIWECSWKSVSWLKDIEARPIDGKAISSLTKPKQVSALVDLAQELLQQSLQTGRSINKTRASGKGPLSDGAVNSFLDLIVSAPIRNAVEDHFNKIINLGEENAINEDDFIHARRNFWRIISPNRKKLMALLRQYIASAQLTLDSFMVAYEFGRILAENRRGDLAYEVLGPLEDQMRTVQVVVPIHHKARILDSIGESARFAGDFSTAKRLYNEALDIDEDNYFALKHLGTIYRIENNFLKAKDCFEKALSVHETYHVLFSLGYLYHDLKHYDDALPYYDKCVHSLKRLNNENYYRVYFKLACLHLIRSGPTAREDALKNTGQALNSLKVCLQDLSELDDFALITNFASNLLFSLVHKNNNSSDNRSVMEALRKCESFLEEHIDRLTHSVFYCAFGDIERVFAENIDLLPSVFNRLNDIQKKILQRILDQLQLKHMLLQSSVINKRMQSLTIASEHIEVLVKPVEAVGKETNALKEALRAFDFLPWRSSETEQGSLETCKVAITNLDTAVSTMRTPLDNLLDRASVSFWLKSKNKDRAYDGASVLEPFTAVLPEDIRKKHFSEYFHVPVSRHETMVRIIGKKLMCLDPLTKNRVFVNPTVGCSLSCDFCYLPEYFIANNKAPTPATIDGKTFREAMLLDNRVRLGKDGTLFSVGSFCEPFLPEVENLTVSILRELQPLGNPIQIASKRFPGMGVLEKIIAIFENEPAQFMLNLSLNDCTGWDNNPIRSWLEHSANICTTIYIKPFLPRTYSQMSRFVQIGHDYPHVSFVVGSFYVGEAIRQKFKLDKYLSTPNLVSPIVDEPKVVGFEETQEKIFRKKLAEKIGRPVFKTASCALSCRRRIKDPLRNYDTPFCIKDYCSNYKEKIC